MKINLIAIFLSLTVLPLGSKSQTIWHVTHPDVIGNTKYVFTAMSGKNQWFTAAANVRDYSDSSHRPYDWRLVFLRSNDGGETWQEQAPNVTRRRDQFYGWVRRIDQIDSLSVVAIGDSGYVLRT